MSAVKDRNPPQPRPTEPDPIVDRFATAVGVDGTAEYIRLTGWVSHGRADSPLTETSAPEQRVVARLVMPVSTARQLYRSLSRMLPKGNG